MSLNKIVVRSIEELKDHIKTNKPTFYMSSQTSTVIPYDKIQSLLKLKDNEEYYICDLSQLPKKMELIDDNKLKVSGAVNWKEAREFLISKGKNLKTYPTEELALVNAGLATSCTGERCFMFDTLRSQVIECSFIDYRGEEVKLSKKNNLNYDFLSEYQKTYSKYTEFKNAPFPRLEKETDLMIGTEGQLGVVTESILEITKNYSIQHLFVLIPRWEEDIKSHLEISKNIQTWRNSVITCEMIDSNSFNYLKEEDRPNQNMDAIFFEVKLEDYEKFYEEFILKLKTIDQEKVFELNASKFHNLRSSIPRAVFEKNSEMGVVKLGTDVQVSIDDFKELLRIYQEFSKIDVNYNLFGHFGDSHLHFNFIPKPDQVDACKQKLKNLYKKCLEINASPFSEHGIGLIKQEYIKDFLSNIHLDVYKKLKKIHDPYNQFFPQGYMNIKKE